MDGVRNYFRNRNLPEEAIHGSWLSKLEFPSAAEIFDEISSGSTIETIVGVEVPTNKIRGPWESKEEYLRAHYELLRDDALRHIREAVCELRGAPDISEKDFSGSQMGIYGKVNL